MVESKKLYTTTAINTGGRNGESYLKDGSFSVNVSTPNELGGSGKGQNPEQLFALGYSACFNSALEAKMQDADIKAKSRVTTDVNLLSDPTDDGFKLSVVMTVAVEGQSIQVAQELAEQAQQTCPYSKATVGNIEVRLEVEEY